MTGDERVDRWRLIRDAAVFQCKLVVDGLRDLLLVPDSLVATLVTLLKGHRSGFDFYDVLDFGKRTERWINLFGAARDAEPRAEGEDLDTLVAKVEERLVAQYERGGVTASAKDAIDRAIDRLQQAARTPPE